MKRIGPPRASLILCLWGCLPLLEAGPVWKAPPTLPYGRLSILELVEEDPNQPPLPRPGDNRLGPLEIRAAHPTADGRGWRITVQPLVPGTVHIPSLDLGDGRRSPELRVTVPRTTAYGAPWKGVGGGPEDQLPPVPFPWWWAGTVCLPFVGLLVFVLRRLRARAPQRRFHRLRRCFVAQWPPLSRQRDALDRAHATGRDLLAARFGEESRSWGVEEFRNHHLAPWGVWVESLDAARFGRTEPAFPPSETLLKALEGRP